VLVICLCVPPVRVCRGPHRQGSIVVGTAIFVGFFVVAEHMALSHGQRPVGGLVRCVTVSGVMHGDSWGWGERDTEVDVWLAPTLARGGVATLSVSVGQVLAVAQC